jgi:hypothetical protein
MGGTSEYIKLQFRAIKGLQIAEVHVEESKHPMFVKDESFFIRAAASTRELKGRELLKYQLTHWELESLNL